MLMTRTLFFLLFYFILFYDSNLKVQADKLRYTSFEKRLVNFEAYKLNIKKTQKIVR